jgi:hypothetical protein
MECMKYYTSGQPCRGLDKEDGLVYIQDARLRAYSAPHQTGHNVIVFCAVKGYSGVAGLHIGAEKPLFCLKKQLEDRAEK